MVDFALHRETEPDWDTEIAADVKDEAGKYGPVLHIHVDKNSKVSPCWMLRFCRLSNVEF